MTRTIVRDAVSNKFPKGAILRCKFCRHAWIQRQNEPPRQCPKCDKVKWNVYELDDSTYIDEKAETVIDETVIPTEQPWYKGMQQISSHMVDLRKQAQDELAARVRAIRDGKVFVLPKINNVIDVVKGTNAKGEEVTINSIMPVKEGKLIGEPYDRTPTENTPTEAEIKPNPPELPVTPEPVEPAVKERPDKVEEKVIMDKQIPQQPIPPPPTVDNPQRDFGKEQIYTSPLDIMAKLKAEREQAKFEQRASPDRKKAIPPKMEPVYEKEAVEDNIDYEETERCLSMVKRYQKMADAHNYRMEVKGYDKTPVPLQQTENINISYSIVALGKVDVVGKAKYLREKVNRGYPDVVERIEKLAKGWDDKHRRDMNPFNGR